MPFNHLEDTLNNENILSYLEFCGELQEPTRTVLGYTLDIASHLHSQNLSDNYAVFGGYAVLSHLMDAFGDSLAKTWRGSTDIDMGGTCNVLNSIRSGYHLSNDSISPNLKDKRTLKLDVSGERECKIDFYCNNPEKKYGASQINSHFGIPLRVIKPEFIIKGKLKTPIGEFQHYGDILGMIAVLEKKGYSPIEISKIFSHQETDELKRRVIVADHEFRNDRFGIFPSKKFFDEVKKELHRRN
jgi:hypothetical protein